MGHQGPSLFPLPFPGSPCGKSGFATWGVEGKGLPAMGVAVRVGNPENAAMVIKDSAEGH